MPHGHSSAALHEPVEAKPQTVERTSEAYSKNVIFVGKIGFDDIVDALRSKDRTVRLKLVPRGTAPA